MSEANRFGPELLLWRGQVIQRRRLVARVQPEEARFGPELDWGKLSGSGSSPGS